MFSIGDVIKVVNWNEMIKLAKTVWSNEDSNEKMTICTFDDGILGSLDGEYICGQIGTITDIVKTKDVNFYSVKFFDNDLEDYDGYVFEEYLIKPYKL